MERQEIFKNIPNYEGIYQVSNFGNVKSLKFGKEKILASGLDGTGYLTVALCKNRKPKTYKIHQLVAMAFLGHQPCRYKLIVDHVNKNPLDNRLENLQIITARKNLSKDKKGFTSKYVGVSFYKNYKKWVAKIRIEGKLKHLGYFECEIEAHKAYQQELKLIS